MSRPASAIDWSHYRFPAEWEKHEATWLAWPHNEGTWPGLMEPVRQTYLQIIQALLPGERVYLCVNDCGAADEVSERLRKAKIQSPNLKLVT
ncbi:MAG: agmatine deiminase family protein, partial [Verrucomicrobiota bacterium]